MQSAKSLIKGGLLALALIPGALGYSQPTITPVITDIDMLNAYVWQNHIYFLDSPRSGDSTPHLKRTDGTPEGTETIAVMYPWIVGVINDRLIVNETVGGTRNLWSTDGTSEGMVLLRSGLATTPDSGNNLRSREHNGFLYFNGRTAEAGSELWRTDGTTLGTTMVKDLKPGTGDGNPGSFQEVDGSLYFIAADSAGPRLWRSDGTDSGTTVVLYSALRTTFADSSDLYENGGDLYFRWFDGTRTNMGKYHITSEIFTSLDPPISYVGYGVIGDIAQYNGDIYFCGLTSMHGAELWRVEGEHSVFFKELSANSSSGNPSNFLVFDDLLIFTAYSIPTGLELWKCDGTPAGTTVIKDINPGTAYSNPQHFTRFGNRLYFTAETAQHGREPWTTDGTSEGTYMIGDFRTGAVGSSPSNFCVLNGSLYFTAFNDADQKTLWKLDNPDNPSRITDWQMWEN